MMETVEKDKSEKQNIRAFLAIDIDDHMRQSFLEFEKQQHKKSWCKKARWTKGDNIHLTLRFLGSITPGQLEIIKNGMQQFRSYDSFEMDMTSPRPFPSLRKPRILAALIHKNESLLALAAAAESLAISAGLEAEKRTFNGHITVARFRKPPKGLEYLLKYAEIYHLMAREVVLYQSFLEPQGARYEKLANQKLKHC